MKIQNTSEQILEKRPISIDTVTRNNLKPKKVLTPAAKKVLTPAEMQSGLHNVRVLLSYTSFIIAGIWLAFIGYLVFRFMKLDPYNTKVMITLLTTATATIIGLPSLTMNGVYNILKEENKARELNNR